MQPVFMLSLLALLIVPASASTSLFARQASSDGLGLNNIPDACQPTCAPIESTITSCQDLSCLCNDGVAEQIAGCANCLAGVSGDSNQLSMAQALVDQYTNACITNGQPISSIQVSSVAPSSLPSGSATDTATSTVTSSPSESESSNAAEIPLRAKTLASVVTFMGLANLILAA